MQEHRKLKLRALRDFVVLVPDNPLKTAPGSLIVIPETADANDPLNPQSGTVISVGCGLVEGGRIIPLKVKVGDRVVIPRNSGTLIKDHPDFEDCFVVRENQIFGVGE